MPFLQPIAPLVQASLVKGPRYLYIDVAPVAKGTWNDHPRSIHHICKVPSCGGDSKFYMDGNTEQCRAKLPSGTKFRKILRS